ncbi:hypothetical protein KIH74_17595 [Kineosporia sp. J2-2]|uniref:Lipoprotein n=1 Tax=Kineosporia corallincola TaxID=2835133 RepID=A0ABS5TI33_9ACTN|nr:hypothetical protein [Kineosporia corallincola]MBT0770761.1 hypothetical protein [Kineosporia corallincola]
MAAYLVTCGIVLAGCGGGSDSAVAAPTASPEVATAWNVDAAQDARWTRQLGRITTKLKSVQGVSTEKAATVRTNQMIALEKVLTAMAEAGGAEGIGHVACEVMPVQLLSYDDTLTKDVVAMQLGAYWTAPVVAAGGSSTTGFADVALDARMQQECSDVHQDVLAATGLGTLDEMYFLTS